MKLKMLFLVSIIGFFCNTAFADAATGICKDGREYYRQVQTSACSVTMAIKEWFGDKVAETAPEPEKKSKSKKSKEKPAKRKSPRQKPPQALPPASARTVTKRPAPTSDSACRGHDGIKEWYADKEKTAPAEEPKSKSKAKADTVEKSAATDPVTGICKDGSETSGTNKRSACRGHDGIKECMPIRKKLRRSKKMHPKQKAEEPAAATGAATGMCKEWHRIHR